MATIHLLGQEIEQKALEEFLIRMPQARLLVRNYRCFRGEIDLIFEEPTPTALGKHRELVFVEVRCRLRKVGASRPIVSGVESLGVRKQLAMRRTADHFLIHYQGSAQTVRYDLMAWDGTAWTYLSNIELFSGR